MIDFQVNVTLFQNVYSLIFFPIVKVDFLYCVFSIVACDIFLR